MKKQFTTSILISAFAALLCLGLISCGETAAQSTTPAVTHTKIETAEAEYLDEIKALISSADKNYQGTVTRWRYNNINDGIGTTTHTDVAAFLITQLIGSLKDTDRIDPALSDEAWEPNKNEPPAEVGTEWYQVGETLYRATFNSNSGHILARVTTHYGEGVILETNEKFWTRFNAIDAYFQQAYYRGDYDNGTLKLTHVYPGEDDISIIIKDFEPGTVTNDPSKTENNLITVMITSEKDQKVTLNLHCARSSDHLFDIQKQTVTLKAGVPKIVRFSYQATTWNYQLALSAQNTRIVIYFPSTKTA